MQATAILVVEDELALRNAVMLALRAGGWNVLDAGSGEAAIVPAACSLKPISALLTAIQLTGVLKAGTLPSRSEKSTLPRAVYAAGNNAARNRQIGGSVLLEIAYRRRRFNP
jgi:CheY-like chemotaxis protein